MRIVTRKSPVDTGLLGSLWSGTAGGSRRQLHFTAGGARRRVRHVHCATTGSGRQNGDLIQSGRHRGRFPMPRRLCSLRRFLRPRRGRRQLVSRHATDFPIRCVDALQQSFDVVGRGWQRRLQLIQRIPRPFVNVEAVVVDPRVSARRKISLLRRGAVSSLAAMGTPWFDCRAIIPKPRPARPDGPAAEGASRMRYPRRPAASGAPTAEAHRTCR
jgi:hypothetical protein